MSRFPSVPVPVSGGIDTKTEDKLVRPPSFRDLQNVSFDKQGGKEKRHGHDRLSRETADGVSIDTGRKLAVVNNELVRLSGEKVYSWSEALDKWADKGSLRAMTIRSKTVAQLHAAQTHSSYATANGISLYAWDDSRGGIRFEVVDEATGAVLYADQAISDANASGPLVCSTETNLHILYQTSSNIYAKTILTGDVAGSVSNAARVIISNAATSRELFDVAAVPSATFIAWVSNDLSGGESIFIQTMANSGELAPASSATSRTYSDADWNEVYGLAIAASDIDDRIVYSWIVDEIGTSKLYYGESIASDLVYSNDAEEVEDVAVSSGVRMSCAIKSEFWAFVWYENEAADTWNNSVVKWRLGMQAYGGDSDSREEWRHVGLLGGGLQFNERAYVPLVAASPLQSQVLLCRDDQLIVARAIPGVSNGTLSTLVLTKPVEISLGVFMFATDYKIRLDAFDVDNYTEPGVKELTFNFEDDLALESVSAGKSLYISGGYLWMYDGGENPVEAGFNLWPENVEANATSGGSMDSGAYSYRVEYQWPNAHGEIIRSFSLPINIEGVTSGVTLTIPTLWATCKRSEFSRRDVAIVVYRTLVDPSQGATYRRVSSTDPSISGVPNGFLFNDPTVDSVEFVDNAPDSTIDDDEPDYLNAEIGSFSSESGSIIGQGKDRILVAGFEDGNIVEFSRLRFSGEQISFNSSIRVSLDSRGGRVTALTTMADLHVAFKKDLIYVIPGSGPSNAYGDFNSFGEAQQVPSDVGCLNQRTLALTPVGVFFQSSKGIRLLTPGLQVVYVGAPVELYNGVTITDAHAVTDRDEVRFLTDDGRTLVFNYEQNMWSLWTTVQGVDAVIWDGKYVYAREDGNVFVGNSEVFTDGGEAYKVSLTLPHLSLGSRWGFQLVKSAILGLRYRGSHGIRVYVSYDGESFSNSAEMTSEEVALLVETDAWGDQPFWGGDGVWGGAGAANYVFEYALPRHKCALVSFKIEEIPAQIPSAAFSFVSLELEAKGMQGKYPMRKAARISDANEGGGGGPGGGSGVNPYIQYGPDGVYCPRTSQEWTDLRIPVPTAWWQCQEESGDLKPQSGSNVRLVKNSGSSSEQMLYRQTISRWNRWFVGTVELESHRWGSVDPSIDIAEDEAYSFMAYLAYNHGPNNHLDLIGMGGMSLLESKITFGDDNIRAYLSNSPYTSVEQGYKGLTSVRPYLFSRDPEEETIRLYTPRELIDGVYSNIAITDEKMFGSSLADAAEALYGFGAFWKGVALDETHLARLGWDVLY